KSATSGTFYLSLFTFDLLRRSAPERKPLAPELEEEEAEKHATQVGEVGHIALRPGDAIDELDCAVDHHKIACLDRHRKENHDHARMREHEPERQQQPKDAPRCPHSGHDAV